MLDQSGYPVVLNAEGAEVVLPDDITLHEAIRMNEEAGRLDGIERIEDDGTVVFADYATEIMKETLGFDCPKFKPEESYERALEMIHRFRGLMDKHVDNSQ